MRIAYVLPGPMSKGPLGQTEVARRESLLNEWAFAGTEVEICEVAAGPMSIESSYEEMLAIPATLELIVQCERNGFDAAIIGCFGDPGLEAARELVQMPVLGPCESSMLLAAGLGHKFSVLTIYDSLIAGQTHLAHRTGVLSKLASVRATNTAVLDLMKDLDGSKTRLIEVATRCVEVDRADSILFGCMTMSFLDMAADVAKAAGVPAVNAAKAALKHAESLVSIGLSHSKRAWPQPAKMAAGLTADSLNVA